MDNEFIKRILTKAQRCQAEYPAETVPKLVTLVARTVEFSQSTVDIDDWYVSRAQSLESIQAAFYESKLLVKPLPLTHPEISAALDDF